MMLKTANTYFVTGVVLSVLYMATHFSGLYVTEHIALSFLSLVYLTSVTLMGGR